MIRMYLLTKKTLLLVLCLSGVSLVLAVGPDITARDRLVKDLPSGVFAGRKLTPKVCEKDAIVVLFCSFRVIPRQ